MYLKLRKYCHFGTKNSRRAWHVIPAQEVNNSHIKCMYFFNTNLIAINFTARRKNKTRCVKIKLGRAC